MHGKNFNIPAPHAPENLALKNIIDMWITNFVESQINEQTYLIYFFWKPPLPAYGALSNLNQTATMRNKLRTKMWITLCIHLDRSSI